MIAVLRLSEANKHRKNKKIEVVIDKKRFQLSTNQAELLQCAIPAVLGGFVVSVKFEKIDEAH